jgi:nitrogenase iron protein NifH
MAIYAGNNILRAVNEIGGGLKVLGYVVSQRGVPREREIVEEFAARTQVPILGFIKRDPTTFKQAEARGGPVVRTLPDSEPAAAFRQLARRVHENNGGTTSPRPFESYDELFDLFMSFQDVQAEAGTEARAAYRARIPAGVTPREKPLRIAVYGTGGIGKSTVCTNVSAALVGMGERVFQIGCDPKHDSIANLCGGLKPTLLDEIQKQGVRGMNAALLKQLIFPGVNHNGHLFGAECGGPVPGKGCAGKGVDLALKFIEDFGIVDEYGFSFVLYDVLGDTVCGGFARPLKYTGQAYIVANGETASLTQAMKIAQSIQAASGRGMDTGIGGIINNMRGVPHEPEIVEQVFQAVGIPVIHHVPRSEAVQTAENLRTTVVESFPGSEQANHYVELARKLRENTRRYRLTREILSGREIAAIVNKHL